MRTIFRNANIINVFTAEIVSADLLVEDGVILGVGSYTGEREIDCGGRYLCPGFIDAHVHIESSMVSPLEFAKTIARSGTAAIVADPHELVNVLGADAISYILKATEHLPVEIFVMLPSSVPATPFETNGADFTAADMQPFLSHPRVLGLGEVMCYPDVIAGRGAIMEKLALCRGRKIDGHAPGVFGDDLQRYCAAGVQTDHECADFDEALEKLRAGMQILIREGSGAKNVETLVKGLVEHKLPTDSCLFCTDDKHLEEIRQQGHIRWNVRRAIACGLPPITAIQMATCNAARAYGLRGMGAVAPGYRADFILLDSLEEVTVAAVYHAGEKVDETYLSRFTAAADETILRNSVRFADVSADRLRVPAGEKNVTMENVPYQLLTRRLMESLPQQDGLFTPNETYSKLCVVERHRGTGNVAALPVKGFGIRGGAIATTVAHDSHNVVAIGDNDEDLLVAIHETRRLGGGYVAASGGQVVDALPLPLAGLMSDQPGDEVIERIARLVKRVHGMGVPAHIEPFITLSFMTLPVIPEIRLTDRGVFNVLTFSLEQPADKTECHAGS